MALNHTQELVRATYYARNEIQIADQEVMEISIAESRSITRWWCHSATSAYNLICEDLGLKPGVAVEGDSNAVKGTVKRARHIQTRYLRASSRGASQGQSYFLARRTGPMR